MKLTQLAARDQEATNRLVAAAEKLAELQGLDPAVLERVKTQRGEPPVRMMLQREAVADLAEALVPVIKNQMETIHALEKAVADMAADLIDQNPPGSESNEGDDETPPKKRTKRSQKRSESA